MLLSFLVFYPMLASFLDHTPCNCWVLSCRLMANLSHLSRAQWKHLTKQNLRHMTQQKQLTFHHIHESRCDCTAMSVSHSLYLLDRWQRAFLSTGARTRIANQMRTGIVRSRPSRVAIYRWRIGYEPKKRKSGVTHKSACRLRRHLSSL